ncbi:MAG: THUMP domain-containing protein [Candidatus Bathyarchaeia archaeon]|nr:RsmD family RNA methyltransferase [Candidatus Bathyarchaeota archaeon]
MARLFFLVSGENPSLPYSEVKSILDAEGYEYSILGELTQVLRLEAESQCAEAVKFRSALAKACCLEIFVCRAELDEILSAAREIDFTQLIGEGETFIVRVVRVRGSSPDISCLALERKIGGIIFEGAKSKGVKVDFKSPDKIFLGVLTDGMFLFGLRLAEMRHRDLLERNPRKRAFFHPAALTAKMARCMVNLARARRGELVLDPFCGTGSILIEAGLIGCKVMGFDVKRYMVKGSMKNLDLFGVRPECMAVADARFLPLVAGSVDRVVTDPPYGTAATTLGLAVRTLLERFFSLAADVIKEGGMMCIAAPKTLRVSEIGGKYGFRHVESHYVYVHRRLTREITVFKRVEGS